MFYWNSTTWTIEPEGRPGSRRIPPFLLVILAPLMGGLFVVFLPLIGFLFLIAAGMAKFGQMLVRGGMGMFTILEPRWRPGEASLIPLQHIRAAEDHHTE